MPTVKKFTQHFVDTVSLPAADRADYWERSTGFGLRVSHTGRKTWQVMTRVAGTKTAIRVPFGTSLEIPELKKARRLAGEIKAQAARGEDPRQPKASAQTTVAAALERYLTECALPSLRPDDAVERVRCLRREAIPIIGHLSISELSRADIRAVVNPIVARGRAPMARNTLGYLRAALGWCVAQDLLTANPAVGVANPDTRRPEQRQRARWLCPEEIGWYWRATEQMSESVFSPMLRLLLLSGVRRDECACAVWSEFNLEARTWTLPRHRTKNSNDFVIHLSDAALDVLRSIPTRERGGLLFTSDGRRPVAGFTHALRRLIKTMAEIAERPIEPFVLHDCRRTIATNLCELGFDAIVVDRLLNHAGAGTASAIARIYNRHSFAKERAAALDAWGRFVLAQAHPEASNVIELAAAR